MLFLVTYRPKAGRTEAEDKRGLNLFQNWKPAEGVTIKSHYARADGGGLVICETNSATAAIATLAPWVTFFDYEMVPIAEVSEAVPLLQKVFSWRESVR